MARWMRLCSDCWYNLFPDAYFPDTDWLDTCGRCGNMALITNVNPNDIDTKESN